LALWVPLATEPATEFRVLDGLQVDSEIAAQLAPSGIQARQ
jgi:hypothetical protein